MRSMWIGQITSDEDQSRFDLLEQRLHDLHVGGPDRVLPNFAGLIEGQVEKARRGFRQTHCFQAAHGLRLADDALDVLYFLDVHFTRPLSVEKLVNATRERAHALS